MFLFANNLVLGIFIPIYKLYNFNMKKVTYSFLVVLLMSIISVQDIKADGGYAIEFDIKNYVDNQMIIAYHYAEQQYIFDTLTAIKSGQFVAQGDEALDPGMYIAFFPSIGKSFEFLVNKEEQHFKLSTDSKNFISNMSVKGSVENERFFGYLNYLTSQRTARNGMTALLEKLNKEPEVNAKKIKEIETKVKALDEVVVAFQKDITKTHPNSFTAGIININTPVEVPAEIRKSETASFYYYRAHFFDNINMTDERFLRSPMLHQKIDLYVSDKVTIPNPDSIKVAVDRLLFLSEGNEEVFKFILVRMLNEYAKSKIVCMDAVYVHLVDNYYSKGKAEWIEAEQLKKIEEDADALRPLMCGQVAPDIAMETFDVPAKSASLHGMDSKYTVLFMWDPDCGHCKKSMPDMLKFYDDYKPKGVEVFAICTKTYKGASECTEFIEEKDMKRWLNVIDPYYRSRYKQIYNVKSTPVVYILNENKEILAKRIGADQMANVMDKIIERDKRVAEEEAKKKAEGSNTDSKTEKNTIEPIIKNPKKANIRKAVKD
ncbi:MAG: thiol-disulfide isomerase/thioredoxin [Cognaticolwellia sp.]|jgi:thiol-disulfide isomerase/thioredoxin|tara:strand:+ start:375 stop:2009 length:1635 start_codon:yes stop_codon:yes gene_type:complete